jgi:phage baseplate assembly protein W
MTDWFRTYPGFRLVETRRGDSLRAVAARELGEAERWWELISANALVPPYLTDDPGQVRSGVLLTGARLSVPSSADFVPASIDPEAVFGSDLRLTRGELTATNGNLDLVSGAANLTQAIRHVLVTDIGELVAHPQYGCGARLLIGRRGSPATLMLADGLVQRAVNADARIDSVTSSTTTIDGDVLRVKLIARAINGVSVQANVPD